MKRLFVLVFLATAAAAARADIIPTLNPGSPLATAGGFTWNYATNVTVDQNVNTGDYFTIYDFGSIVPNSNQQPTGWVFSTSLTGVTPSQVLPNDNPNLLNLTWTYIGTGPIQGASFIGDFSVVATTNLLRTSDFAAEATRNSGPNAGTKIDNVGQVSVPVPEMSALLPILSVCGAAIIASVPGWLHRRRKN